MSTVAKVLKLGRDRYRQWRLEQGEAGWGAPVPPAAVVRGTSLDKTCRVAVIGAGNQGIAHCRALKDIPGVEIAGVADLQQDRLERAGLEAGLPQERLFRSADEMLAGTPVDLVTIATTAPSHIDLANLAARHVERILIEKPLDASLAKARLWSRANGVRLTVSVNYSRRWLLDYQAIRRVIDDGAVGQVVSVTAIPGKGELAMHGSHYFDLCRYLLADEPVAGMSRLEPLTEVNPRGPQYQDPSGFCLFLFQRGGRAFIDFSSDYKTKDATVLVKGTQGWIAVDELRQCWMLSTRSGRLWTIPFAERMSAALMFRRTVVQVVSEPQPKGTLGDGLQALEMIYCAHLSQRQGNRLVPLPLSEEDAELGLMFA